MIHLLHMRRWRNASQLLFSIFALNETRVFLSPSSLGHYDPTAFGRPWCGHECVGEGVA